MYQKRGTGRHVRTSSGTVGEVLDGAGSPAVKAQRIRRMIEGVK